MRAVFGNDAGRHAGAWAWLEEQQADVALLHEVVLPEEPASWWGSVLHTQKYPGSASAWGCAVLAHESGYRSHPPSPEYPWLLELGGSACVAAPPEDDLPWLVSLHASDQPLRADRLVGIDVTRLAGSSPGELWEIEVLADDLHRLLAGKRFLLSGDLNGSPPFDTAYGRDRNRLLSDSLDAAGFVELRRRHHIEEPRTSEAGSDEPRFDHVFADPATEAAVGSWTVASEVVTEHRLSDHAPVVVDLDHPRQDPRRQRVV